jgi:hypothetical protein
MRLWVTTACKEVPCRMLVSNPADPILRVKAGAGSEYGKHGERLRKSALCFSGTAFRKGPAIPSPLWPSTMLIPGADVRCGPH